MGSSVRSQDHPDGRAIFYEETTYGKRKISDFISTLEGFQASLKIVESFAPHVEDFHSRTLTRIVTLPDKEGLCEEGEIRVTMLKCLSLSPLQAEEGEKYGAIYIYCAN